MKKTMKISAIAVVLFLAAGVIAFAYAGSQNALNANADDQQTGTQNMQTFLGPNNQTFYKWNNCTISDHMRRMPQMRANDLQLPYGLLENATLSTVNGTVVSEVKGMLILDTDLSQIRVLLPKDWTVGDQVVGRASLLNGTFASPGQSVTVNVLESNMFSNANFNINVMLGYEVANATGTQAYAVLPFNIQPTS